MNIMSVSKVFVAHFNLFGNKNSVKRVTKDDAKEERKLRTFLWFYYILSIVYLSNRFKIKSFGLKKTRKFTQIKAKSEETVRPLHRIVRKEAFQERKKPKIGKTFSSTKVTSMEKSGLAFRSLSAEQKVKYLVDRQIRKIINKRKRKHIKTNDGLKPKYAFNPFDWSLYLVRMMNLLCRVAHGKRKTLSFSSIHSRHFWLHAIFGEQFEVLKVLFRLFFKTRSSTIFQKYFCEWNFTVPIIYGRFCTWRQMTKSSLKFQVNAGDGN